MIIVVTILAYPAQVAATEPAPVVSDRKPPAKVAFFVKPIITTTEMGKPEKELIAKQEAAKRRRIVSVPVGSGGYSYGYCTAYASAKRPDLPKNLSHARYWVNGAAAQGYATGHTPQVGAIVQTAESDYGHVAYVEGIEEGHLILSEQNYRGWGVVSTRKLPINSGVIRGYIY